MPEKYYCGLRPPTKHHVLGSPEYCASKKRINYYGYQTMPTEIVDRAIGKIKFLLKEYDIIQQQVNSVHEKLRRFPRKDPKYKVLSKKLRDLEHHEIILKAYIDEHVKYMRNFRP